MRTGHSHGFAASPTIRVISSSDVPAAAEVDEGRFLGGFVRVPPSGVKWAGPAAQPYRDGPSPAVQPYRAYFGARVPALPSGVVPTLRLFL